ncbi:MAG: NAD(P)H-quinone oxidoreductase [Pseudomonadota bacterium]
MSDMRVTEIQKPGGPEVLVEARRPPPAPRFGEVVIKVAYAGVNRPDALQRAGLYNPPPDASDLPGLEASGEIAEIGPGVTGWKVGDKVCALLPGGGYAEYVATPAAHCMAIPEGMSLAEAGALPETVLTVWSNVVMRGGLKGGERFLVHGGSSGIGTMAIQIARALGARVFATAGSEEKCQACVQLGAERALNYREADFVEMARSMGGMDLILDMVGGPYIARNLKSLADDGRLVQIAFLQGPKTELNFVQLMTRRLTITGSTLRPQSDAAKAQYVQEVQRHVWPLIATGKVGVVMHKTFDLAEAAQAHAYMESSQHIGKLVLKL